MDNIESSESETEFLMVCDPDTLSKYALGVEELRYDLSTATSAGLDDEASLHLRMALDTLSQAAAQLELASIKQARALASQQGH